MHCKYTHRICANFGCEVQASPVCLCSQASALEAAAGREELLKTQLQKLNADKDQVEASLAQSDADREQLAAKLAAQVSPPLSCIVKHLICRPPPSKTSIRWLYAITLSMGDAPPAKLGHVQHVASSCFDHVLVVLVKLL